MTVHAFVHANYPPENVILYESPAQRTALLAAGWKETQTLDLTRADIPAQITAILATPAPTAPAKTTDPVIAGAAGATAVGTVFTVTKGVYAGSPAPTVTRQWKKGTTNITGETKLTYDSTGLAAGDKITCVETATNASGNVKGTSNEITLT